MRSIVNEKTESIEWVLERLKSIVNVSPCTVAIDQSPYTNAAIRKVFPVSYISLDDWLLNKNQLTNASRWCNKIRSSEWARDLIRVLHTLRSCSTIETFEERRKALEDKYDTRFLCADNLRPPQWYQFLYLDNPSVLMTCYKNLFLHRRFFFQGSGYTEAFQVSHQKLVLKENVLFSELPLKMRR